MGLTFHVQMRTLQTQRGTRACPSSQRSESELGLESSISRLEEIPLKSTLSRVWGPGSPQPREKSHSCRSSCNFLAGLGWSSLPGLSQGVCDWPVQREGGFPALLRSLTSLGFHHPAGPGSEDLHVRSLFQTWGAPCLHGALAHLQAALPARSAAHRQASLPTSPRPCCG